MMADLTYALGTDNKVRILDGDRVILTLEEGKFHPGGPNICAMLEANAITARLNSMNGTLRGHP